MAKDLPWNEAIRQVLREAGSSLHYTEIAERIVEGQLRTSVGATPMDTVASVLTMSLKQPNSPFQRLGRGQYALKETLTEPASSAQIEEAEGDGDTGALQAFGVFWKRDEVDWKNGPRLLGRQGTGATTVDFSAQVGVYLLHDRDRVIYVGRADEALLSRLKAHTTDRLGGRWDRFSWFGLRGVTTDGKLSERIASWSHKVVVDTLEALLIEALEPPLNRRRGDKLEGKEYQQVMDPELENRRVQARISELMARGSVAG